MDRQELLEQGKEVKTEYGIAKEFEWKVIDYKNKRYQVSMFNDEIIEVNRTYCGDCGRASYGSICCGSYKG